MYSIWMYLLLGVWFCESAGSELIFTAEPHHLRLHGRSPPWFTLSCSMTNTSAIKDVYIIEIGRQSKHPMVSLSALDPHTAHVLDKPNIHRMKSQGRIGARSSHLLVKVTNALCEDVTSYYCLTFFVNSTQKAIQEDRRMLSVKGSDVTVEISPSTYVPGQTTNMSVTCIFERLTTNVHYAVLGRKVNGKKSPIAALNTTHRVPVGGSISERLTLMGGIENTSIVRLEANLSPVLCEDVTQYYCIVNYTSGSVVKTAEDTSEVTGHCYDTTPSRLSTTHSFSTLSEDPRKRHPGYTARSPTQEPTVTILMCMMFLGQVTRRD
ncbi:uncharacterized protein [Haliotis asinina]|uniref:uncharacterized protein n=1 Tax=Haliotis asinina TaxID=109174 RepID=UPI00353261D0